MPHICADEILAFLSVIPFLGIIFQTYRAKIHAWFHKHKGEKTNVLQRECPHDHEHKEDSK